MNPIQLDKSGTYTQKDHEQARKLVYKLMAASSDLLRDLPHMAWLESAQTPQMTRGNFDPKRNPISPENPNYNPATGSAPPLR